MLIQVRNAGDVRILKGVMSKDHVHMLIEYPPRLSISDLVNRMKRRSSTILQDEFPGEKKRYWGRHFLAIGYGGWSSGNITDEMVQEYLEYHRDPSNGEAGNIMLE
jgi:putative transposase